MLFLVVDGIDGSGKTSVCKMLTLFLEKAGGHVVLTKEPNEPFRKLILEHLFNNDSYRATLLAFLSNRAFHVKNLIKPALNDGNIVICDRFQASTHAYLFDICPQTDEEYISQADIYTLNKVATNGLNPDIEFIIDTDYAPVQERIKERGETVPTEEELNRVSDGYISYYLKHKDENVYMIDGNCDLTELMIRIICELVSFINKGNFLTDEANTKALKLIGELTDREIGMWAKMLVSWYEEEAVEYTTYDSFGCPF